MLSILVGRNTFNIPLSLSGSKLVGSTELLFSILSLSTESKNTLNAKHMPCNTHGK